MKVARAEEEQTEQRREVEAQERHESDVKAQEGHEGEVKAQEEQGEDANSLHEGSHVSNRHMTWWHNAWWVRVKRRETVEECGEQPPGPRRKCARQERAQGEKGRNGSKGKQTEQKATPCTSSSTFQPQQPQQLQRQCDYNDAHDVCRNVDFRDGVNESDDLTQDEALNKRGISHRPRSERGCFRRNCLTLQALHGMWRDEVLRVRCCPRQGHGDSGAQDGGDQDESNSGKPYLTSMASTQQARTTMTRTSSWSASTCTVTRSPVTATCPARFPWTSSREPGKASVRDRPDGCSGQTTVCSDSLALAACCG